MRLLGSTRRPRKTATFAAFVALVIALLSSIAAAHEVGLSSGTYGLSGASLTADLVFSRRELVAVISELDADWDGTITPTELAGARPRLLRALAAGWKITGDGR